MTYLAGQCSNIACRMSDKVTCPKDLFYIKILTNIFGAELYVIPPVRHTTDRVHVMSTGEMAMDQLHFLIASLVLTAVNTDISGY